MEYKLIILGGTFDKLHAGHKEFLRFAFSHGEQVRIGITSDEYVAKHKRNQSILSYENRKKEVESFLRHEGLLQRTEIVVINSKFDETQNLAGKNTALLVSSETYLSGLEVNKQRKESGLEPLPLIVMPVVRTKTGEKISSSDIRSGFSDTEGNLTFFTQQISLPEDLRQVLHHPFGTLFVKGIPSQLLQNPERVITVGDITTKRLHDMGITPKLSVIDFFVERKSIDTNLKELGFTGNETMYHVINPPGKIMPEVWGIFAEIAKDINTKGNFAVVVDGEEDLLVIPLILLLPVGFTIFYGQPKEGIVAVSVGEESKRQLRSLLKNYL